MLTDRLFTVSGAVRRHNTPDPCHRQGLNRMPRQDAIRIAEAILAGLNHYLTAGLVLALFFVVFGIDRVTPQARGSWLFRLLVIPGVVGLWPLVLVRWIRLERNR